jgi:hypothetical protein
MGKGAVTVLEGAMLAQATKDRLENSDNSQELIEALAKQP